MGITDKEQAQENENRRAELQAMNKTGMPLIPTDSKLELHK